MKVSEIENYILTSKEAAAISAAVSATAFDLMMSGDPATAEILRGLQTGMMKVMRLNEELRKGIEEARKENANG